MSRRPVLVTSFLGFVSALTVLAAGNLPTASGQPKQPAVTPAPQAPTLTTPANFGAAKDSETELTLTGTNLAEPTGVLLSCPGKVAIPTDNKNGSDAAKLRIKVQIPADCPIGLHTIRLITKQSVSNLRPFLVDDLPVAAKTDGNRSKDTAPSISVPAVVNGRIDAEMTDYYKVKVEAGQRLTFEVLARRIGSPLDPILLLHDAKTKRALLELYVDDTPGLQSDCRITHTFKEAGEFLVEVRDSTYRGGPDYFYRLRIGDFPGVTTAYPVAIERGKTAEVRFAGPGAEDVPPVKLTAPSDPTAAAIWATPKRSTGVSGWPVPVLVSDWTEVVEQEPNDEPAKATKLPVPGGVSARFDKARDLDHFAITVKKGQKLVAAARTFEINTPTEVLIRVLDPKGAEVARSNPLAASARVEFTPASDGEYVLACEHLNYLFGPNEVYHLSVRSLSPDFEVTLPLDRTEAPVGCGTAILANVNRLNGYAGPVELSISGDTALSGSVTVPNGQTFAFVPLMIKEGTKPGAYRYQVQGKAEIEGKPVVRYGTQLDLVKANLGGMPNPPADLLAGSFIGAIEKPAFSLKLTPDPQKMEKGKGGKVLLEATRNDGDADILVVPFFVPANVTAAAAKPIPKGQTKGEIGVTLAPATANGPAQLIFRSTSKVGGKDYAFLQPPLTIEVVEPKKTEPKKEEPKKEEPKKDKK